MENGLAKRLVQVGIRTLNSTQQKQVEKFGVEVHQMRDFNLQDFKLELDGPVYITIDIDALDPAFAPGVSHFEPGGLAVRDILSILQGIDVPVVGADIVEYNPERDISWDDSNGCCKISEGTGRFNVEVMWHTTLIS